MRLEDILFERVEELLQFWAKPKPAFLTRADFAPRRHLEMSETFSVVTIGVVVLLASGGWRTLLNIL